MRPHVFIATPCYGGVVTQGYMQSVVALMAAAPGAGIDLTLALLGQDALITRCRNTLVAQFMSVASATHLLFVDADISFRPENLLRLLAAGRSIVAGIYPLKAFYWDRAMREREAGGESSSTAGLHYVGQPDTAAPQPDKDGFVSASHAGTGFMLIERNAICRMQQAYPETAYKGIHAYQTGSIKNGGGHALFDCVIDPATGIYTSEDFTFCSRWRATGGSIWLDTRSSLTHTGPADFVGQPEHRYRV